MKKDPTVCDLLGLNSNFDVLSIGQPLLEQPGALAKTNIGKKKLLSQKQNFPSCNQAKLAADNQSKETGWD